MSRPQDAIPKLSRGESVEVAQKDGESASGEALPEGWADVAIAEVANTFTGSTPSKKESQYYGGDVPFFKPTDLDAGYFVYKSTDTLTDEGAEKARLFPADSVLVTCIGATIGKTGLARVGGATNQQINIVVPYDELADAKFLFWCFVSNEGQRQIKDNASATTLPILNKGRFNLLRFPLPPRAEQSRIVSAIESLQERSSRARVLLSEVGPLIGQLRQSVLRDAFSGKLTADWRARRRMGTPAVPSPPAPSEESSGLGAQATNPAQETASELLLRIRNERRERWQSEQLAKYEAKGKQPPKNWQDKYKEPEPVDEELLETLPELPEDWAWTTWELILSLDDGSFKRGPFGSSLKKSIFVSEGYKVYEQYCPINDDCSFVRYYITPEKFDELKAFAVRAKDFLISCSGVSLGRITQVPETFEEGVINQAILRVRLNPRVMEDLYFKWLFRSPFFQEQIFANAGGSAIPNVKGVKDLKAIPVPLPPLKEQSEIVNRALEALASVDEVEHVLASMESSLTQLDQSILSKAFRGELVPQDPRDEPASQLLARIRTTREKLEAEKDAAKKQSKKRGKKRSGKKAAK